MPRLVRIGLFLFAALPHLFADDPTELLSPAGPPPGIALDRPITLFSDSEFTPRQVIGEFSDAVSLDKVPSAAVLNADDQVQTGDDGEAAPIEMTRTSAVSVPSNKGWFIGAAAAVLSAALAAVAIKLRPKQADLRSRRTALAPEVHNIRPWGRRKSRGLNAPKVFRVPPLNEQRKR